LLLLLLSYHIDEIVSDVAPFLNEGIDALHPPRHEVGSLE
jgi:hypothetical protein